MEEYCSPFSLDIPTIDLTTYVFSSGTEKSRKAPQYFDADRPSRNFSLEDGEVFTRQIAKGLENLGLRRNDTVLLYGGNSLHFPVLFWGCIAAGCIFTGCSGSSSVQELSYQLKDSGAKLMLVSPTSTKNGIEAAKAVSMPKNRVFSFCDVEGELAGASHSGLPPWTDFWAPLLTISQWSWKQLTTLEEVTNQTAVINYSSGTTGLPKGVEISHYNLISNTLQVTFKRKMVADTNAGKVRAAKLRQSGDRILAQIPMYHAYGQTYFCINAAVTRSKVYIMQQFDLEKYLAYMDIYRITYMTNIPAIMGMLSKHPYPHKFNLTAVEQVVSGSAALGKEVARQVESLYLRPEVLIKQGWGMTECTCSATGFAPDDGDDDGSVGWLNPNMTARIVKVDDYDFGAQATSTNFIGEVWISGPNIMKSYFRKPAETEKTIVYKDGKRWLRTGDVGYFDSKGRLFLVGRMKELIKVNGLQVAPAEIQAVLQAYPGVADAVVVAANIDNRECPRAFVVRTEDSRVTGAELQSLVQSRLSKHKWLTGGVFFLDQIPRTPSGKAMQRLLPQSPVAEKFSKL